MENLQSYCISLKYTYSFHRSKSDMTTMAMHFLHDIVFNSFFTSYNLLSVSRSLRVKVLQCNCLLLDEWIHVVWYRCCELWTWQLITIMKQKIKVRFCNFLSSQEPLQLQCKNKYHIISEVSIFLRCDNSLFFSTLK